MSKPRCTRCGRFTRRLPILTWLKGYWHHECEQPFLARYGTGNHLEERRSA